jgi:hypothetical protein
MLTVLTQTPVFFSGIWNAMCKATSGCAGLSYHQKKIMITVATTAMFWQARRTLDR